MGLVRSLAFALALAGCAKQPMILGERLPKGCKENAPDLGNEYCVGWVVDRMLLAFGLSEYDDRAITGYVSRVGMRLARASGKRLHWKFRVTDDPEIQAFTLMGGMIYIQRGTLAALRSEAELAAVLGHEMGHVLGGHARESFADASHDAVRTPTEQSHKIAWARDDEIQADELAVMLTARAGYDPRAVVTMLRALAGTQRGHDGSPDDVHPWWPERIARAQALVARHPPAGELGEERYRTRLAQLIVDRDPRAAERVGNTLVFARANLAVDLPAHKSVTRSDFSLQFEIAFDDGATGHVWLVSGAFGEAIRDLLHESRDGDATEVHVAGASALLVTVDGHDAKRRASALRAAIRAPRRDEIANLHPRVVDLNRPRPIWTR